MRDIKRSEAAPWRPLDASLIGEPAKSVIESWSSHPIGAAQPTGDDARRLAPHRTDGVQPVYGMLGQEMRFDRYTPDGLYVLDGMAARDTKDRTVWKSATEEMAPGGYRS